ncbi:mucin-5AC-like isoform X2 [Pomacea canaliculata]|uniref:mucin-5AC-like isoform X2 n=1 Tax=Pomacea canaliculata TaxID=400727 RepID=UPI000D738B75|nr:mucin-5AC-like isoform X2 [Pomacea canaliculata]
MTAKLYTIPLFVAKILILVTRNSEAFPTGAPDYNCRSMRPGHTTYPVPITDKFPFIISASSNSVLPGEVVVISVTGEEFQGFLAVSSKLDGSVSEIVPGMVPIEQGSSTKTLNCVAANNQHVLMSGVTQTRRLGTNKLTFQWMAPTTALPGSIYQIRVVVVQSFSLYWEPYVVNIVIRSSNEPAKVTTVSQIPASAGLTTSEGLTVQSTVEVSTTSSSAPQPSTTSSSAPQPSSTTSSSTPQPSTTSSSASQPDTAAPSSSAQPNRILTPSSSPRHAAGDGENRMQSPFPASPTVPSGSRSSSLNSSSPTTASLDLQIALATLPLMAHLLAKKFG